MPALIPSDPAQRRKFTEQSALFQSGNRSELAQLKTYLSGQKQVNSITPSTFLFESFDDAVVNSQNSSLFYEALVTAGVPSEAHIFQHGTHGAGLSTGDPVEGAGPGLFHNWLFEQGLLVPAWKLVPPAGAVD